jgi:hypothetical protein
MQVCKQFGKPKNQIFRMKEYLGEYLEKYFIQILNRNGFELLDSSFSGIGGIYRFEKEHLKFNIINDRGILETSISSIYSKNAFDFGLLYIYFLKKIKPESIKPKFGKNILSKRLNLDEESAFFEKQFDWIKTVFNKTEYLTTENELLNLANDRMKLLFGNNL